MRPRQPVRPGVEAGGQNHRLLHAVAGGVEEEIVEEAGAHRDRIGLQLQVAFAVVGCVGPTDVAVGQADEEVQPDRSHQWRRERVIDDRVALRLASARAAATIVAVAPTLEARSQLS